MSDRRKYTMAHGRAGTRIIYISAIGGCLGIAAMPDSERLPIWGHGIFVLYLVGFGWLIETRGIHTGLDETEDGFLDHDMLSDRPIRAANTERFDRAPTPVRGQIRAVSTDGCDVYLRGVSQGRRARWAGGETRDILSVLNERLGEQKKMLGC